MQIITSGSWSPFIRHSGENTLRAHRQLSSHGRLEWTEEERRWWEELMARSRERNVHFETDGRVGVNQ